MACGRCLSQRRLHTSNILCRSSDCCDTMKKFCPEVLLMCTAWRVRLYAFAEHQITHVISHGLNLKYLYFDAADTVDREDEEEDDDYEEDYETEQYNFRLILEKMGHRILSLSFDESEITNDDLIAVGTCCNNLEALTIPNLNRSLNITPLTSCKRLRSFFSDNFQTTIPTSAVSEWKQLTELSLRGDTTPYPSAALVDALPQHLTLLRLLRQETPAVLVKPPALQRIADRFGQTLTTLELRIQCESVGEEVIPLFTACQHQLESLNLCGSKLLVRDTLDDSLREGLRKLSKLRYLNLSRCVGVNDATLYGIGCEEYCPHLIRLDVSENADITGSFLYSIAPMTRLTIITVG
eukprot:PhF_6_TR13900/c0_g1_i3/m.22340